MGLFERLMSGSKKRSDAVTDAQTAVLFPIGFPMGYTFRPDVEDADDEAPVKSIRLGDETITVDIRSYLIWEGAFSHHERNELIKWSEAESKDPSRMAERLDQLTSDGLLVEVPAEIASQRQFFARYFIVPTGVGIGNSRHDQDEFSIGHRETGSHLFLNAIGYSIWTSSGRCRSILDVITSLNAHWGKNENELVEYVFTILPSLFEEELAYLDVV
jgi:hypothetical protein